MRIPYPSVSLNYSFAANIPGWKLFKLHGAPPWNVHKSAFHIMLKSSFWHWLMIRYPSNVKACRENYTYPKSNIWAKMKVISVQPRWKSVQFFWFSKWILAFDIANMNRKRQVWTLFSKYGQGERSDNTKKQSLKAHCCWQFCPICECTLLFCVSVGTSSSVTGCVVPLLSHRKFCSCWVSHRDSLITIKQKNKHFFFFYSTNISNQIKTGLKEVEVDNVSVVDHILLAIKDEEDYCLKYCKITVLFGTYM